MDSQGRVLLPVTLRDDLGLKGEVVIVGNNTSIEIWAKDNWVKMEKELEESVQTIEFCEGVDL
jgi:MraZ protein